MPIKNNKVNQLIKEIAVQEPNEPVISMVSGQQFITGFSVLFTHNPKADNKMTRESYAESLKKFGLEKKPQTPWSMVHSRMIPKLGTVSYSIHFYTLQAVEVEITTDIGTKSLNSKLLSSAELKQNVESMRSALRAETKEVMKILNMIDDPKLAATYGAA